ncbi:hypothetical protein BgiBS90_033103 [Biomphalaria glabrata]|nr:hypothetical protein BgiBS90_033103 [Biomphalaria glabrata]
MEGLGYAKCHSTATPQHPYVTSPPRHPHATAPLRHSIPYVTSPLLHITAPLRHSIPTVTSPLRHITLRHSTTTSQHPLRHITPTSQHLLRHSTSYVTSHLRHSTSYVTAPLRHSTPTSHHPHDDDQETDDVDRNPKALRQIHRHLKYFKEKHTQTSKKDIIRHLKTWIEVRKTETSEKN